MYTVTYHCGRCNEYLEVPDDDNREYSYCPFCGEFVEFEFYNEDEDETDEENSEEEYDEVLWGNDWAGCKDNGETIHQEPCERCIYREYARKKGSYCKNCGPDVDFKLVTTSTH